MLSRNIVYIFIIFALFACGSSDKETQAAVDFAAVNLEGKAVKLSDFRGKFILLDVWATWCGPCVAEIPNMIKVYQKIDKKKLEFISVCIDAEKGILKEYVNEKGMKWTQFKIAAIPCLFLLNREGEILLQNTGLRGGSLLPTLHKYLNSPKTR